VNATERAIWDHVEAAHAGDLDLRAFERWLHETPDVEAVLGRDGWLEMIARNYRERSALHDTQQQIERLYAERRAGQLPRDRARRVAGEFLDGRRDLWSTCRHLARLWTDGHETWIPIEFVGIDSELDDIPAPGVRDRWDPVALRGVLDRGAPWLESAHQAARDAASAMLDRLDIGELSGRADR